MEHGRFGHGRCQAPVVARTGMVVRLAPARSNRHNRGMCLGIPAQIVEVVDAADRLVKAEISGVRRTISLALLGDEARVGDWVLIHVGFALSKIDEDEARETLALLERIGEPYEQELAEIRESAAG